MKTALNFIFYYTYGDKHVKISVENVKVIRALSSTALLRIMVTYRMMKET
jgi:hypothetical protein